MWSRDECEVGSQTRRDLVICQTTELSSREPGATAARNESNGKGGNATVT